MPEKYTIAIAQHYVAEHIDDILEALENSKDVPQWMKESVKFKECWKSGCWLNMMLKVNHGATEKEVHQIGFAHGQRSVFSDTWEWAVRYLNEYAETHAVADKPGIVLADEINNAAFGNKG